jgi:hypothetical protein
MGKQGCAFFGTRIPSWNIARFILESINTGSNCVFEITLRGIITYPSRKVVMLPQKSTAWGIDLHKDFFVAALIERNGSPTIKRFDHAQDGLLILKSWILAAKSPLVAMESTGNYWRPLLSSWKDMSGIPSKRVQKKKEDLEKEGRP